MMPVPSASPAGMFGGLWRHRQLIVQLARQEIIGRYRGSLLGVGWSFITPILMLLIYTFVFSVVFGARWSGLEHGGKTAFAIVLFLGMAVFSLFSEVVVRAPMMVVSNANYVKRVVFPLEILPVVQMVNALFHFAVSLLAWVLAALWVLGRVPVTALALPVVIVPVVAGSLGVAWALASLGVYLRDLGQTITLFVTAALFLTPIFYPIEAIPETYRHYMMMNPLAHAIEQARWVMIEGRLPSLLTILTSWAVGFVMMWLGYAWFQKTRAGFADVL